MTPDQAQNNNNPNASLFSASPRLRVSAHFFEFALAALLFVFLVAGLIILPVPFTRDQGIYAYNAWRWLADDLPYRDAFDHKGPLLYAIYAVGLKGSGGAAWGINLLDLLARAGAVLFTGLAFRRVASERAGLLAAAFTALPLFGVFNSCWWNAQAETFMLPLAAASAWLVVADARPRRRLVLFIAGLLAGQIVALKPTGGVHGLFLGLWLALAPSGGPGSKRGADAAVLGLGAAAGALVWVLYFAAQGAAGPLYEALIEFNLYHSAGQTASPLWPALSRDFPRVFQAIVLLLIPFAASLLDRGGRRPRLFALAWLVAGLAQILVQKKFFPYHWLTVVPGMGAAAGLGLDWLAQRLDRRGPRWPARAAIGAVLLGLLFLYARLYFYIEESYRVREYLLGRIDLATYYARFNASDATGKGDFNLLASAAAADSIRKNTPDSARVLVFGFEPIVNYLSARPAPTRFEIDYPLTFTPRSDRAAKARDRWRAQFMAELAARPPELVLIVSDDANALEPEPSDREARAFTAFWSWLQQNYEAYMKIEDFEFWRKKRSSE